VPWPIDCETPREAAAQIIHRMRSYGFDSVGLSSPHWRWTSVPLYVGGYHLTIRPARIGMTDHTET
jgi:hypothetical protein